MLVWLFLVIFGYFWLFLVIFGYFGYFGYRMRMGNVTDVVFCSTLTGVFTEFSEVEGRPRSNVRARCHARARAKLARR